MELLKKNKTEFWAVAITANIWLAHGKWHISFVFILIAIFLGILLPHLEGEARKNDEERARKKYKCKCE